MIVYRSFGKILSYTRPLHLNENLHVLEKLEFEGGEARANWNF